MKRKANISFIRRAAMTLLLAVLTTGTAWAQGNNDIENFTITLMPGDGTGSTITINSHDDGRYFGTSSNGGDVGNGQFFTMNGELWFKFPDCPDSFTAPDGYLFDGWDSSDPGTIYPVTSNMTLVAHWTIDTSQYVMASYTLSPTSYTLAGSGYTDIPCTLTSLNHGKYIKGDEVKDTDAIAFTTNGGTLKDGNGHSISFLVDNQNHNNLGGHVFMDNDQYGEHENEGDSFVFPVYISPNDFENAVPGAYTGKLIYESIWCGSGSYLGAGASGEIELTLIVPEPVTAITLADDADNTDALDGKNGKTCDVTLDGRTIYCDGDWNTLCLPFNVSDFTGTPLEGFTVKELDIETLYDGHTTGLDGTTLYLNFKNATSITAGVPYIVKKLAVKDDATTPTYSATAGTAGSNITQQNYPNLVDGQTGAGHVWRTDFTAGGNSYCVFRSDKPVYATGYTLTTGNQQATGNPTLWTLSVSADGNEPWTVIDSRNVSETPGDALPGSPSVTSGLYTLQKPGTYQYFRFDVYATSGNTFMCLSELTMQGKHLTNVVSPTFSGVTVSTAAPASVSSTDGTVTFVGSYSPVDLTANDKTVLYLGGANTLYWPSADMTIGSCRALFRLGGGAHAKVRAFNLSFGDEATGIVSISADAADSKDSEDAAAWYSLDGVKLNGKPTQKGIYINNGYKIVIK